MSIMYITRREVFSASHRLWNPRLTESQNIELFDKCANANGHGHNFVLEVTVAAEVRSDTGYAVDFKKLKELLRTEIIDKVDHKHLNYDVDFLNDVIPTAENVVRAFWKVLASKLREGTLKSIRLHETPLSPLLINVPRPTPEIILPSPELVIAVIEVPISPAFRVVQVLPLSFERSIPSP